MGESARGYAHLVAKLGAVEPLLLDDKLYFVFVGHNGVWFESFYKGRHYISITKIFKCIFTNPI